MFKNAICNGQQMCDIEFIRSLIALYFWDRVDLLSGVGTVLSLFAEET